MSRSNCISGAVTLTLTDLLAYIQIGRLKYYDLMMRIMCRDGCWHGLHDTIHIMVNGSRYDYIKIFYSFSHSSVEKETAEIQVTVCDLGSLNSSHHIILIIQQTN